MTVVLPAAGDWEAWRLLLGCGACVVYRGGVRGWFVFCGGCELEVHASDEQWATWYVGQHDESRAHQVAVAVLHG